MQIHTFTSLYPSGATLDLVGETEVNFSVKAVLIVAGILALAIIGAFFISVSLGVAAIIGGVFFLIVFGVALARGSSDEDELYEDE